MFSLLPRECILQIALNFTPQELTDFSLLCKDIARLCIDRDDYIWEHYCIRDRGLNFKSKFLNWFEMYFYDSSKICHHLIILSLDNLIDISNHFKKFDPHTAKCNFPSCPIGYNRLWYCATPGCKFIGCGRRDNAHAKKHWEQTKHSLLIKLNTVEMWCYDCKKWCGTFGTADPVEHDKVLSVIEFIGKQCNKKFLSDTFIRRQKERELQPIQQTDTEWAIIELKWYIDWTKFLVGDLDDFITPCDNAPLLNPEGSFNFDLIPRLDWTSVSIKVWDHIQNTYGGGPEIINFSNGTVMIQ